MVLPSSWVCFRGCIWYGYTEAFIGVHRSVMCLTLGVDALIMWWVMFGSKLTLHRCFVLVQIETNKPGGQGPSEGVLANFFNSLLSKKTATNSPPPGAIKANGECMQTWRHGKADIFVSPLSYFSLLIWLIGTSCLQSRWKDVGMLFKYTPNTTKLQPMQFLKD